MLVYSVNDTFDKKMLNESFPAPSIPVMIIGKESFQYLSQKYTEVMLHFCPSYSLVFIKRHRASNLVRS